MSWKEKALDKLEAEEKTGQYDKYANVMKNSVREALVNFCDQNEGSPTWRRSAGRCGSTSPARRSGARCLSTSAETSGSRTAVRGPSC